MATAQAARLQAVEAALAEERAKNAALCDDVAALKESFQRGTWFGLAQRADQARIARVARNKQIRALDPEAFISAVASLPKAERHVGLQPAQAIAMALSCTGDLRRRLVEAFSDGAAEAVHWALHKPIARVRVSADPKVRLISIPPTRIAEEDAVRADAAGLRNWHEVVDDVGDVFCVEGFEFAGRDGIELVMPRAALDLWAELNPNIQRLLTTNVLRVEPVSDDQSRELSRRAWMEDEDALRAALPPLPLD